MKRSLVVSQQGSGRSSTDVVKRSKTDQIDGALVEVPRTSDLPNPIMKLTGHKGCVNSLSFSSEGKYLASGSFDRQILIWNISGSCENIGVLEGHRNSVQDVCWSNDSERLTSCSADKTVRYWDINTGDCLAKCNGHAGIVNSCDTSMMLSSAGIVASGSDDKTLKTWDPRSSRKSIHSFEHEYMVTAVKFACQKESSVPPLLFSGSVDAIIRAWDLRKPGKTLFELYNKKECDGVITGLDCGKDGSYLVANASDGSFVKWDSRVFVAGGDEKRLLHSFKYGHAKPALNKDNLPLGCCVSDKYGRVAAGSAQPIVSVWNSTEGNLEYKLPGHMGPVVDVAFHPVQSIVASGSVDKVIFLGELE